MRTQGIYPFWRIIRNLFQKKVKALKERR